MSENENATTAGIAPDPAQNPMPPAIQCYGLS